METFKAWVELMRPVNGIMSAFAVVIGYIVAGGTAASVEIVYAAVAAFAILGAGMAINDYYDLEIDKKNKPYRPLPSKRIHPEHAKFAAVVLFAVGIALASLINPKAMTVAAVASFLLVAYAWKLVRIPLIGNATVALSTGLTFIFGEALVTQGFSLPILTLFSLSVFGTFGREIYKSIEDMKADRVHRKTLPMVIGVKKSALVAGLSLAIAIAVTPLPYLLGTFGFNYIALIALVDAGLLYVILTGLRQTNHKAFAKQAKQAKLFQLVALIAFLVGAL